MTRIKITGGAKIGLGGALWPFVSLIISPNRLDLHASILGSFSFAPSDIMSIEPVSGFFGNGIRIHHKVSNYKKRIEFQTSKDPVQIINKIQQSGFLDNKTSNVQSEIREKQQQGSFSIRILAFVLIVAIWNILFFFDFINYVNSGANAIPLGHGAIMAAAFLFFTAFSTNFIPGFRKYILKEGRDIAEIRTFLYFMMFGTGMMIIMLTYFSELIN